MIHWEIMSTSRQAEQENLWRWLLALLQELTTPAGRRRARARVRSAVKRAGLPRLRLATSTGPRLTNPMSWRPHELAERLARRTRRHGAAGRQGSPSGGLTVRERYGEQFYSSIGARGGSTVLEERGVEYLQDIGARGGAATRQ